MAEVLYRIDNNTAFQMAMVCAFFDFMGLVGLIPIVGTAINWMFVAAAEGIFYLWLKKYNIQFFKKPSTGIATIIAALAESFFGFLPAISAQIGIIVIASWGEDKLKSITSLEAGKSGQDTTQVPKESKEPQQRKEVPSI